MPQITTLTGLARAVGRSRTAVRAWLARDDWPFSRRPPWPADQIEEIRTWAALTLQENRNAEGLLGAGPAADPGTADRVLPDECAAPAPRRTLRDFLNGVGGRGFGIDVAQVRASPPTPLYRPAFDRLGDDGLEQVADRTNRYMAVVFCYFHGFDPKERHTDDEWRALLCWALDHERTTQAVANVWGGALVDVLTERGLLPRRRVTRKAARR